MQKHKHKRSNIKSTATRLRLSVYRSLTNIYAQIINDEKGETLVATSSLALKRGNNIQAAKEVGKILAEIVREKKIPNAFVFDRGNRVYHGRIKALVDSAREHGLNI